LAQFTPEKGEEPIYLLPGTHYSLDPKWSKERKEQEVEKWRTWWRENRDKLERPIGQSAWRPPKKEDETRPSGAESKDAEK